MFEEGLLWSCALWVIESLSQASLRVRCALIGKPDLSVLASILSTTVDVVPSVSFNHSPNLEVILASHLAEWLNSLAIREHPVTETPLAMFTQHAS